MNFLKEQEEGPRVGHIFLWASSKLCGGGKAETSLRSVCRAAGGGAVRRASAAVETPTRTSSPKEGAPSWQVRGTQEGSIWRQIAGTRKWSSGFLEGSSRRLHPGQAGFRGRAEAPGRPSGVLERWQRVKYKETGDRKNSDTGKQGMSVEVCDTCFEGSMENAVTGAEG